MPKRCYRTKKFQAKSLAIIDWANKIIERYDAQGLVLTLRQLYYQFVARDLIPNNLRAYKRLSGIVNDARYAGLIDWDHIIDRTRVLRGNPHWDDPEGIIYAAVSSYAIDKWAWQDVRPEVWIEKDALIGVIEDICGNLDVSYFACRGYNSGSVMYSAAQRLVSHYRNGQVPVIIHLGDHDPSGTDMSRDVTARLEEIMKAEGCPHTEVRRIALNMEQIETYRLPPNLAKDNDTRTKGYTERFGNSSWELDALKPSVLVSLIENTVLSYRDDRRWNEAVALEAQQRAELREAAKRWDDVTRYLNGGAR